MHILNLKTAVTLGGGFRIEAGEYVVDDHSGAQLAALAGGGKLNSINQPDVVESAVAAPADSAESVLFFRTGGYGDLILLTPVLREHKRRWPNARIGVVCMADYGAVLQGLPFVDEVLPYPITTAEFYEWDRWFFFEGSVEHNEAAKTKHMTDIFAEIAGVHDLTDKRAEYRVSAAEAVWANVQYPRTEKPRCCVQVGASARARMYAPQQLGQVIKQLLERGWEVFMMGGPGDVDLPESNKPELKNLTRPGLTFRQSCAVINTADVVLGPDSALVHVAGALGVPCVALYGPFPWELRTKYAPTTTAISGHGDCAPCFHHFNAAARNHFPEKCPSAGTGWCGVLASIKPDRIAAKVQTVARDLRAKVNGAEVVPFVRSEQ